jgi:hypothetical protein
MTAAPKGKRPTDQTRCRICDRVFRYRAADNTPPPAICGQVHCRARHEWGPEDWAGRARMATARATAGRPLDDLDHEALRRARPSVVEEVACA